jgi:hypothetical protein
VSVSDSEFVEPLELVDVVIEAIVDEHPLHLLKGGPHK